MKVFSASVTCIIVPESFSGCVLCTQYFFYKAVNRSALKEKEGREDDAEDEVEVDFEHKLEAIVLLRALCFFSFFACKRVLNFGNNCGSITIYLSNFLQHLPKETHIAGWLIGHLHLQHCLSVRHHPNMCTHTKKKNVYLFESCFRTWSISSRRPRNRRRKSSPRAFTCC